MPMKTISCTSRSEVQGIEIDCDEYLNITSVKYGTSNSGTSCQQKPKHCKSDEELRKTWDDYCKDNELCNLPIAKPDVFCEGSKKFWEVTYSCDQSNLKIKCFVLS